MKDKWVIQSSSLGYHIQWYNSDVEDLGAFLGEGELPGGHFPVASSEDHWANGHNFACDELTKKNIGTRQKHGFVFDSLREAKKALGIVNACMKSVVSEKPWPQWAIEAKSAGWKPPKNWRP